MIISHLPVNES